jgi:gas vesicle protein
MTSKTQEDLIWGALIGGAVAAAAVLFLTPKSGKDVRKKIESSLRHLYPQKLVKAARRKAARPVAAVRSQVRRTTKTKKATAKKVHSGHVVRGHSVHAKNK